MGYDSLHHLPGPLLIRIHTHRRVAFIFGALDFLCDLFCGDIYICRYAEGSGNGEKHDL